MQQQFIYWNKQFTLELAFKHECLSFVILIILLVCVFSVISTCSSSSSSIFWRRLHGNVLRLCHLDAQRSTACDNTVTVNVNKMHHQWSNSFMLLDCKINRFSQKCGCLYSCMCSTTAWVQFFCGSLSECSQLYSWNTTRHICICWIHASYYSHTSLIISQLTSRDLLRCDVIGWYYVTCCRITHLSTK